MDRTFEEDEDTGYGTGLVAEHGFILAGCDAEQKQADAPMSRGSMRRAIRKGVHSTHVRSNAWFHILRCRGNVRQRKRTGRHVQ